MSKKRKPDALKKQRPSLVDTVLLLSWRKLLLVLFIWGLSAALTWALFGPLNGLLGTSNGPAGNNVTDLLESGGDVLIATWGGGVSRYDGRSWQTVTSQDGLADDRVAALAQTGAEEIWFGTYGGASQYDGTQWRSFSTQDGLASDIVLSMAADADDNVWLGTAEGLSRYDSATGEIMLVDFGEPQAVIRALYIDDSGRVWAGTNERGLFLQDGGDWQNFTIADGLAHDHVEAIYQDSQDTIWVGTIDGLGRYDGADWQIYTTADGLPSNIILTLGEDEMGGILAGTNGGLARFDGRSWQPVMVEEGATTATANAIDALLVGPDGTIWIGGRGLSYFDGNSWQSFYFQAGILATAAFILGTVVIPIYLVIALVYTIIRTQPRSRYLRFNRYTLLLIPAFVLAALLHNLVYAMFYPYYLREGSDEGVFLMLALLAIPFYILLTMFNTILWLFSERNLAKEGAPSSSGDRR